MTSAFLNEDFFMDTLRETEDSDMSQSQAFSDMAFVQNMSNNQDSPAGEDPAARTPNRGPTRREQEVDMDQNGREVPEYLEDYWHTASERIKRIGFEMHPVPTTCMQPRKTDVSKMYSCSKCFTLMDNTSNTLLCSPTQSPAFVFMADCRTEIPSHIQSVFYFFNALSNDISNFQFFALPTKHASISVYQFACPLFIS